VKYPESMSARAIAGYELWDTESRNLLDDFDTEAEALEAVRELLALNGPESAHALALTRVYADGRMITVAQSDHLATLASANQPASSRLLT
jgi:hypothetical protein